MSDRHAAMQQLFGFGIEPTTLAEAAEDILEDARGGQGRQVVFVNAHCVNVAARNTAYCRLLRRHDRLYADGRGMALAARLAGSALPDNVNGTDLLPLLCERAAVAGVPLALLGAAPGVAATCAARLQARFPGLQIPFVHDGFFTDAQVPEIVADINRSGARILLVAMGVPRQELWIDQHAASLEVPVLMAVGGLFDFYAGVRRRAPRLVRRVGMEWVFRLALEPCRLFRRYIFGNPIFLWRALRLRLQGREALRTGGRAFSADTGPADR